jgi:hydroxymethylpyrimidine pyrophosphatase-like HAD family hydrolase
MNYKLIAVDLDGTLLKGLNTIPKKSLMALKRFTDAGGKIVISTGRAITSARKIANKIEAYTGKKIPYIISLCGGIIYDHENNIIFEKLIDKTTTKKIADKVKELKAYI